MARLARAGERTQARKQNEGRKIPRLSPLCGRQGAAGILRGQHHAAAECFIRSSASKGERQRSDQPDDSSCPRSVMNARCVSDRLDHTSSAFGTDSEHRTKVSVADFRRCSVGAEGVEARERVGGGETEWGRDRSFRSRSTRWIPSDLSARLACRRDGPLGCGSVGASEGDYPQDVSLDSQGHQQERRATGIVRRHSQKTERIFSPFSISLHPSHEPAGTSA